MRNIIIPLAIFLAPVAAAAQTQAPAVPPPIAVVTPVAPPVATLSLKGEPVFVYSFLDIRKDEFGAKILAQFHSQLMDALKAGGVSPQLVLFADTTQGSLFVPARKIANGQHTFERPPVLQTVHDNDAREKAAGTHYRLLVLPANYEVAGAWRYYTVRWIVMDAATDRILWKGDYKGSHLVMMRTNENSEGRGRKLVEGGLTLMRSASLL
jgi:hypothetical protein